MELRELLHQTHPPPRKNLQQIVAPMRPLACRISSLQQWTVSQKRLRQQMMRGLMTMVHVSIRAHDMLRHLFCCSLLPGPALQHSKRCQLNTTIHSHVLLATMCCTQYRIRIFLLLQVPDSVPKALMLVLSQQQPEPWTQVASQSTLRVGTPQMLVQLLQKGHTGRSKGLLRQGIVLRPAKMGKAITRKRTGIDQRCAKLIYANTSWLS